MSIAKQIAKEVGSATGNARQPELHDSVLHPLSRIRGTVIEVGTVSGETVLSVRTATGRVLSKLNRKEFVLDNRRNGVIGEPITASQTYRGQEIMERRFEDAGGRIEGPISDASILDEIC